MIARIIIQRHRTSGAILMPKGDNTESGTARAGDSLPPALWGCGPAFAGAALFLPGGLSFAGGFSFLFVLSFALSFFLFCFVFCYFFLLPVSASLTMSYCRDTF